MKTVKGKIKTKRMNEQTKVTTIISWVRRDKVWSPGFNVKMVLLSRAAGSVSSGNLSAFDVKSSKARETTY